MQIIGYTPGFTAPSCKQVLMWSNCLFEYQDLASTKNTTSPFLILNLSHHHDKGLLSILQTGVNRPLWHVIYQSVLVCGDKKQMKKRIKPWCSNNGSPLTDNQFRLTVLGNSGVFI